ncbi:sensor histidine kinase [Nocardia iowensis]|uniref:histidine kinase n=1 Tax=Nocardia iowensis TaxID=204891 RepID=A0ABX8RRF8_NOCIO|nr:histidine kinase [Nocardia iowensis]QXN92227.1 sensor histidine kinase [Nocardia iowensis]
MSTAPLSSAPPLRPWSHAWRLAAAAAIGLLAWSGVNAEMAPLDGALLTWFHVGDPLLGVACILLTLWRRRYPVPIAVIVMVVSTASVSANGAAALVLCSLATRRRYPETIALSIVCIGTGLLTDSLVYPKRPGAQPDWYGPSVLTVSVAAIVAIGFAVGARRDLVWSLRSRAETAEREQHARAAEARLLERNRIAREMHDVLAHRISVVAMHAGALGFRTDLTREQTTATAKTIAENAHLALQELREVLGVLRTSDDTALTDTPEPPQPTLADLTRLVDEARAAGMDVSMTDTTTADLPATSARTAYRIAQEGLTNARKHAPGASVRVRVDGGPGHDLIVDVGNAAPVHAGLSLPSSGYGLLGLTERAELVGGTLDYGPDPAGGFQLRATLPWPVDVESDR